MADIKTCYFLRNLTVTFVSSGSSENKPTKDEVTDLILDAISAIKIETENFKIENVAAFFSMNNLEVTEEDY